MERIVKVLNMFYREASKRRRIILVLSCLVVFVTTYMLILPALTLEKEKAAEQGGIDIPAEVITGVNETNEDAAAEEVTAEVDEMDEDAATEEVQENEEHEEFAENDEESAVIHDSLETADTNSGSSETSVPPEITGAGQPAAGPLTFEGDGFNIAVEDTASVLPDNTKVVATELVEKPAIGTNAERKKAVEAYKNYYDLALGAINDEPEDTSIKTISFVKFYDISLQSDSGEIQPDSPVNVTISYADNPQNDLEVANKSDVRIIHFAEDKNTGDITAEVLKDKNVDVKVEQSLIKETTFEADSFSVYAVVYTVDFEYISAVDGKTYTYSIDGGSTITLTDLLPKLGVVKDDTDTQVDEVTFFVEQIDKVDFSDHELVEVRKTDGDWALVSLQPFTSEESLTITMKTGEEFVVKVTDDQVTAHVITADGKDYTITVTYDEKAEIPEGAVLKAEEIKEDSDEYNTYSEQAMKALYDDASETGDDFLHYKTVYARFFDISIICDGKKIEPKAPVSVNIAYSGKVMDDSQDMNVVHFASTGIEVISAETGIDDEQISVQFEQSSFSVTGTIVNYVDIDAGDYYIVHYDNEAKKWYALATDGTYVDITNYYHDSSSSISGYDGSKNISWEVAESGEQYVIKAKGENKYITLSNGSVTGNNRTNLNLHSGTTGAKNTRITIDDTYTHTDWGVTGYAGSFPIYGFITYDRTYPKYALGWDDHFIADSSEPYDYWGRTNYYDARATDVQFAKLSEDSEVVNTDWPNNTYNEAQLEAWLNQALNEDPLKEVDKIGYVYDYDNRVYEIDFSAKSGVLAIANDLSLAFVTDVSNSMLFPSSLTKYQKSNVNTERIKLTQTNLNSICSQDSNLKTGKNVFFTVADISGTSTVCALYRQNGTWYAMDASYYARWQAGIKKVNDDNNYDYVGKRQITIKQNTSTALHKNDTKDYIDNTSNAKNAKAGDEAHSSVRYTIYTGNEEYFTAIQHKQIYDISDNGNYGVQADGTLTSYNIGNRLYNLEDSVSKAVNDVKSISATYPLGGVYVGLETFAKTIQGTQQYLKVGGYDNTNMAAANSAYNNNYNTLYNMIKDIKGVDGTNQKEALEGVSNLGTLPAGTDKYVVLITDGAPNVEGVNPDTVAETARTLKNQGYKVITVGLSVRDVAVAPELLWRAASFVDSSVPVNSNDKSKAKYYYYAESGDDLSWILREIVRTIMKEATVSTTITDEIDDLFYPVSKDGTPLASGEWINLSGEKVASNAADAAGRVTYDRVSGTWTVKWTNQATPWAGWKGTVFVKAKEDFMGGNNVNTNVQANFIPESYSVTGSQGTKTAKFSESVKNEKTVHPDSPYVNVDELHMTQNSTEWTVYLGTEVDPKQQLEKLWDDIKINTVVDTDGMNDGYTMKTKADMYYDSPYPGGEEDTQSPESGVETIPLSHYIPSDILTNTTNGLLKQLQDENTESSVVSSPISYAPYGQEEVGSFIVTLTKVVNEEAKTTAPESHKTEKASDYEGGTSTLKPVETYVLTVSYSPKSEAERKDLLIQQGKVDENDDNYQHHGGHGMAKEATESTSENKHKINVFAKKLEIIKTDQGENTITEDSATFVLYRKATPDELSDASVTKENLTGLTGKYVAVQTLTTNGGSVTTDVLPAVANNEPYYLVETKAPKGYTALSEPLRVTIDMAGHNTWTKIADNTTSQVKPNPYVLSNWLQEATIQVWRLDGSPYDPTQRLTYDHINDTTDASVTYKIINNNVDYELPSAGGIGTTLFYVLGSILVIGSTVYFVSRRRISEADRK